MSSSGDCDGPEVDDLVLGVGPEQEHALVLVVESRAESVQTPACGQAGGTDIGRHFEPLALIADVHLVGDVLLFSGDSLRIETGLRIFCKLIQQRLQLTD